MYFALASMAMAGDGDDFGAGGVGEADGCAAASFVSFLESNTPPTVRPTSTAITTAAAAPTTAVRLRAFCRALALRSC